MNKITKRTGGMWAAVVALPLALSACGDQASVAQAPDGTDGVISVAGSQDVPGGVAGGPLDVAPGSEVDPKDVVDRLLSADQSQMSSFNLMMNGDVEGAQMQLSASVNVSGAQPELDARLTLEGDEVAAAGMEMFSSMHLVLADGQGFVSIPALTGEGTYYSIPLDEADLGEMGMEGMGAGDDLDLFAEDGLEEMWQGWDESGSTMTYVGSQDGQDQYQIVMTAEDFDASMSGEATFNIWINQDDFMSQIEVNSTDGDLTLLFEDWGHNEDIQAPPAPDVMEFNMEDLNF
ncbi:hypothetical protein [Ornithinimicrobium sp. INDO-MA30-4]|uniref:LolA family protein n=1 Tax=Ornithinimicrobium sp. INDO-MA30-4 TaxID=2908651 RepID=UPI001F22BCB8|nr:hypothetical protein [Ornithinimicrobium sp. INDO-MA30-4]UJH70611.1 hypothetical protein L0A91_00240 [Ornithinimicrobium sp. INDO-MA30-4]